MVRSRRKLIATKEKMKNVRKYESMKLNRKPECTYIKARFCSSPTMKSESEHTHHQCHHRSKLDSNNERRSFIFSNECGFFMVTLVLFVVSILCLLYYNQFFFSSHRFFIHRSFSSARFFIFLLCHILYCIFRLHRT